MKPNQLEQYKKELEEKKEKFQPKYDIIKPYIDYMQKKNEKKREESDFAKKSLKICTNAPQNFSKTLKKRP